MPKKSLQVAFVVALWLCGGSQLALGEPQPSKTTDDCLACHATLHPGIVSSWKKSSHSVVTPQEALAVEGLSKKVSSPNIPESLRGAPVGCAECHTLNAEAHPDSFEHNGYNIHVVVSPKD